MWYIILIICVCVLCILCVCVCVMYAVCVCMSEDMYLSVVVRG